MKLKKKETKFDLASSSLIRAAKNSVVVGEIRRQRYCVNDEMSVF